MMSSLPMTHLFFNILMMSLFTPLSAQSPEPRAIDLHLQNKLAGIRELAIIKAQILQRLGITEPPLPSSHAPRPEQRAIDKIDYSTTYKLLDLVSLYSEPSDEFADDKIIQFQLGGLTTDTRTVIESVNLLLRIKYKTSLNTSIHALSSDINFSSFNQSLGQSIDGQLVSKHLTKTEKGRLKALWREQKRKANELPITIMVSNVTDRGEPDVTLTKVKSTIRKSKSMKLSLPVDLIRQSSDGKNRHFVCIYNV